MWRGKIRSIISSFQGLGHQQSCSGRIPSNKVTTCFLFAWLEAEAVFQDRKKYLKNPLVMAMRVGVLIFPGVCSVTFGNIPSVLELVSASSELIWSPPRCFSDSLHGQLTKLCMYFQRWLSCAAGWVLSEHSYDSAFILHHCINGMNL